LCADFRPCRWRWYVPLKRIFASGLHGDISQNTTKFITTAVRTCNTKLNKSFFLRKKVITHLMPVLINFMGIYISLMNLITDWSGKYYYVPINQCEEPRCNQMADTRLYKNAGSRRPLQHIAIKPVHCVIKRIKLDLLDISNRNIDQNRLDVITSQTILLALVTRNL
jgi:hypothetical protein